MNIYEYQNRSLAPLFTPLPYSQPIKRNKNKVEYIRSLNLLLLAIKRLRETHFKEFKEILPNLTSIVDNVECTLENGYQEWITKKFENHSSVNNDKLNICNKNNHLNELENLLLILLFQNLPLGKKHYDTQSKLLLKQRKDSVKTLVKNIRTKTHTDKSKYTSLIKQYGMNYINCYMSLQILFISAYSSSFRKFLAEIFKENRDKRFEEYEQQEQQKGIKWDNKRINEEFLKDNIFNGSSYYYFDIYAEFIEAIKENKVPKLIPVDPHTTSEVLPEKYTVLCDRDVDWWLLEKMKEDKLIYERNLFQREIDNYPLFSLLDVVIAEVFFPGINELYDNFVSVGHAYERSDDQLSHYLSSGCGRLSYLLTCADNGEYKEEPE